MALKNKSILSRTNNNSKSIILFLLLVALCFGCTRISNSGNAYNGDFYLTETPLNITAENFVTGAPPTPTNIPATTTPTTTKLPTITPLPTLEPNEAMDKILSLFEDNGGCIFPCWWGIIPGDTTWENAKTFLSQFALEINLFINKYDQIEYYVYLEVPEEVSPWGLFNISFRIDKDGVIELIRTEVYWNLEFIDYSLSSILSSFGKPKEVWLHVQPELVGKGFYYYIVLFYPDLGIMTATMYKEFLTDGEMSQGLPISDTMEICPKKSINSPELWLWSPNEQLSFEDVARNRLIETSPAISHLQIYLLLEDATNIDTEQFYSQYVNGNTSFCFETPVEIWLP